jgi:hypothetical protein
MQTIKMFSKKLTIWKADTHPYIVRIINKIKTRQWEEIKLLEQISFYKPDLHHLKNIGGYANN